MTIGFDAKRALNNGSGLGNYSRNLINALTQHFPNNEYLLFSPKAKDEFFHQLTGEFKIVLPETQLQKSFHPLWRSFGIKNQLLKSRVDIYHGLSNEIPFGIPRTSFSTVVTIHDLIFLKHKEQYPFADRQVYQLKTKYAAKHANKIIAVSQQTKNDLVELYGISEKKIEVIYPIVDSAYQATNQGQQQAAIQKYNLPAKYILHVGSFFPRKNHETLVEAFNLIKDKVEENLVLIGNAGLAKEKMEFYLQKQNLQQRVKIITGVSNHDLPSIYKSASLFVFPSLYEGFGMPIVEALFSKVPVIATKGGCFEEAGGKNSVYINPNSPVEIADGILKVLNNTNLKTQMIETGLAHAQTMSAETIAEKTMKVYNEVAR